MNCLKIKLYGSPTTKELKKKHSSRLVKGVEIGSQGGEDSWQGCGWRMSGHGSSLQSGGSHICMWINQEEQQGSETHQATQGSSAGK